MMGFVVTLPEHVEKLLKSGWGAEFIGPDNVTRGEKGNSAVLVVDLSTDPKKLYHAALNVFPQLRDVLPELLEMGRSMGVDDVYLRTMRPFMKVTGMEDKDIIAATMRHICDKADAFASIMQSEAWIRAIEPDKVDDLPRHFKDDPKSVEVLISAMETYEFARMLTLPIHRKASKPNEKRDAGTITGFGDLDDHVDTTDPEGRIEGRLVRFLKPLKGTP